MLAAEYEGAQGLDIRPHGHVDNDPWPEWLVERGRIAVPALQPPDEAGTGVAEAVYPFEVGHELGHDTPVERATRSGNVELGKVRTCRHPILHPVVLEPQRRPVHAIRTR